MCKETCAKACGTCTPGITNFVRVVGMNEQLCVPKGDPGRIDAVMIDAQIAMLQEGVADLSEVAGLLDIEQMRKSACGVLVTVYSLFHVLGLDADTDLQAVVGAMAPTGSDCSAFGMQPGEIIAFDPSMQMSVSSAWDGYSVASVSDEIVEFWNGDGRLPYWEVRCERSGPEGVETEVVAVRAARHDLAAREAYCYVTCEHAGAVHRGEAEQAWFRVIRVQLADPVRLMTCIGNSVGGEGVVA